MHVDPDGILIVTGRNLIEIEFDRLERFVNAAVVSELFYNSVD